ncbi:MAG: hypothetical protein J7L31_01095 [Thermoplasmata archaeon]|nr:hypothetical protein [Thermoplasmata archaeon]
MKKGNVVKVLLISTMLLVSIYPAVHGYAGKTMGWYYKPGYANYAPNGMPDFDQKQDAWQVIKPGPNGVVNSVPWGDDVYNSHENVIAPGANCHLDTTPAGDDVVEWAFCGPVAAANCLWWFDSKYADPKGTPGDGKDEFALVKDYGVGDDHSAANVPKLIEDLAKRMQTNVKGTTYITDMKAAIEALLKERKLNKKFSVTLVDKPSFDHIEEQVERSQDVILLLYFYNTTQNTTKAVDQQQIQGPLQFPLTSQHPGHAQTFIPTVNSLDAVQLLLSWNVSSPPIEVYIWRGNPANHANSTLLGVNSTTLGAPSQNTWVQFHFEHITLNPGTTYYISVVAPETVSWHYVNYSEYQRGNAWIWNGVYNPEEWDFAFKTEYYTTEEHLEWMGGHYVTVAGVNSAEKKIAISDPYFDNAESGGPGRVLPPHNPHPNDATKHNDAAYVSHDHYSISAHPPSGASGKFMLDDYPATFDYTVVAKALIICPKISVSGVKKVWDWQRHQWGLHGNYTTGETIRFRIDVENDGGYNFTSLQVIDMLPDGVEYAGNATPFEPVIEENQLIWEFETLGMDENVSIEFDTIAIERGYYINHVEMVAFHGEENAQNATEASFDIKKNTAPQPPAKPSGPSTGRAGREYTYSTFTTDAENDLVYYLFDWGDGSTSGWLGPYESGEIINATHTWESAGSYSIKVKAKDIHDVESDWSEPLAITMPKSFLHLFIKILRNRLSIMGRDIFPLLFL